MSFCFLARLVSPLRRDQHYRQFVTSVAPAKFGLERRGSVSLSATHWATLPGRINENGRTPYLHMTPVSSFSTETSSASSYSPLEWWRNRQAQKEEKQYKERIENMASKDTWRLSDTQGELDEVVKSWAAKIPVLNQSSEVKMAQSLHKTVTALIQVVGADADDDRLEEITRAEKLQAALAAETSVEEINILIKQFQNMALMHRVLRHRKVEGKPLPTTSEALQLVMQVDAPKFLTKAQKARMTGMQTRLMRKSMKRR